MNVRRGVGIRGGGGGGGRGEEGRKHATNPATCQGAESHVIHLFSPYMVIYYLNCTCLHLDVATH